MLLLVVLSLFVSSSISYDSLLNVSNDDHALAFGSGLSQDVIPSVVHIVAVLPIANNGANLQAVNLWKRGEEILPGATLALKEIKQTDNLLNGHRIELLPITISSCSFNNVIVPFVKEVTSSDKNVIAIVNYFCHNRRQHFSYLLQRIGTEALQVSARASHYQERCSLCQHRSILPSMELRARAVVKFIKRLEWSQVAIISNVDLFDSKQVFLFSATEHGIDVALELEAPQVSLELIAQFLQELLEFGLKVIVALVSPSEVVDIMCISQQQDFRWPDYAWIFMEVDIESTIKYSSKSCSQHIIITAAVKNSIFVRSILKTNEMDLLPSGHNYSAYFDAYLWELEQSSIELNYSLDSNPYASVLYDSIWAVALALNGSLSVLNKNTKKEMKDIIEQQLYELSFQGATGYLNFSQPRAATVVTFIELLQFKKGRPEIIGVYNASLDDLDVDLSTLGNIPSTSLARRYILFPSWLTVMLSIMIVICIFLTILSMCTFFYYRNQPAIKATSTTLSISMFIGCFLLLVSSLFHTINSGISKHESSENLRRFVCLFDVYFVNIGFDMVFTTVIAKTLRIYFIFKSLHRVGRFCSDPSLFTLQSAFVCFKLVLLVLWTIVDINHLIDVEQYVATSAPPYILVAQQCHSRHLELWIGINFAYSFLLLSILTLLAVMTRKIKRDHFNDTKKINTLTAVFIVHLSASLLLWFVLRIAGFTILSKVMYTLSSMLTAVFCQVFLIAPKIVPLVLQRAERKNVAPRHQLSNLSFVHTDITMLSKASRTSLWM